MTRVASAQIQWCHPTKEGAGTSLDSSIKENLGIAEERFRDAVSRNSLDGFARPWNALLLKIQHATTAGLLTAETIALWRAVSIRIETISRSLANLEHLTSSTRQRALGETRRLLATPDAFCHGLPPASPLSSPSSSSTCSLHPPASASASTTLSNQPAPALVDPHKPYRAFFLAHFAHPYPTQSDLGALAKQQDALIAAAGPRAPHADPKQVRTWFINSRRRSGWAAFFKTQCHSSRPALEALLAREARGEALEFEVAEELAEVRRHMERAEEGVREGLSELMAATTLGGGAGGARVASGGAGSSSAGGEAERRRSRDEAQASLGLGRIIDSLTEEKDEDDFSLAVPKAEFGNRGVSGWSAGTTDTRHSSGSSLLSYESAISNTLNLTSTTDVSSSDFFAELSLPTATQPPRRSSSTPAEVPYESAQSFIYVSQPDSVSLPAPAEPNPYFATTEEMGWA